MATTGPRGIALGLRAVRTLASSDVLDRLRMRDGATRVLYRATRDGFRAAGTAGRTFTAAKRLGSPARLAPAARRPVRPHADRRAADAPRRCCDFATERLRPAAQRRRRRVRRRRPS